jgi:hypothetical protein
MFFTERQNPQKVMLTTNRAAIILERLMYFGIMDGCGTKIHVSSFRDVSKIVFVVDFTQTNSSSCV